MDFSSLNLDFWILQTIAMMVTCFLLPKLTVSGPLPALGTVIALAFVNAHIWDAALFFSVPDSPTSHALIVAIANGVVFWVVVKILPGIEVTGVVPAILAPIVFTVTSIAITTYGKDIDWGKVWDRSLEQIAHVRDALQASGGAGASGGESP